LEHHPIQTDYYPECSYLTKDKDIVEVDSESFRLYTGKKISATKYYLVRTKKRFGSIGKYKTFSDGKSEVLVTHYGIGGDKTVISGVIAITTPFSVSKVSYDVR
jgi:hypothetical protein